jgi:hypothetical protein
MPSWLLLNVTSSAGNIISLNGFASRVPMVQTFGNSLKFGKKDIGHGFNPSSLI